MARRPDVGEEDVAEENGRSSNREVLLGKALSRKPFRPKLQKSYAIRYTNRLLSNECSKMNGKFRKIKIEATNHDIEGPRPQKAYYAPKG